MPKQFAPSVDGNFIIVTVDSQYATIVTIDNVTFPQIGDGVAVASGQYIEYSGNQYVSAKSFIEVTVQEKTYDSRNAYVFEYEPID